MTSEPKVPGPDPFSRIDKLIHAPARLKLVTLLHVVDAADATFLMNGSGLTWGNLSTHLTKLESAGYVKMEKGFHGKRPRTMISLTDKGREEFRNYRDGMRQVLGTPPD